MDRRLEETIQSWSSRVLTARQLERACDLSQDLRLANDQRIQPGRHVEQMTGSLQVLEAIEKGMEVFDRHAARIRQKGLQLGESQLIGGRIQLGAIAGGDNDQLGQGQGDMPAAQAG